MPQFELGPIYEDIGRLVSKTLGLDADGAFLYAQAGRAWVGGGIYKDLGNHIVYRYFSDELCDRIADAWNATEADKKWSVMQYTIANGSFQAQFDFSDEPGLDEDGDLRCQRVLRERYGDKPVDYSDPEPR